MTSPFEFLRRAVRCLRRGQQKQYAVDHDTGLSISGWGIDFDRSHPEVGDGYGRCKCGKPLDENGEHGGGYGAWCG